MGQPQSYIKGTFLDRLLNECCPNCLHKYSLEHKVLVIGEEKAIVCNYCNLQVIIPMIIIKHEV